MNEQTSPVAVAERITNLDTARGIAALGILVMNAVSFGLPTAAYSNLSAGGSETALDWVIGVLGEVFVDQKMMALFSLLFGAGIVVFAERAEAKGRRALPLSLWRNVLLLGIGFLHSLVWEGDILRVYALCAPVLLLTRKRSPRLLMGAGVGLVLAAAVWATFAQTVVPANGDGLAYHWYDDEAREGSIDVIDEYFEADPFLRALGMMLIGVALYRLGIVQGTKPAATYRRMAVLGLGLGLPLATAGVAWQFSRDFSHEVALVGLAPNTIATIPIAMGYLSLIALWNQRATTSLHRRLRAVGRMALTNYLTQTLLGIFLLPVVLDLDRATRTGVAAFVGSVWLVQLLWSGPWLQRFRFGPFEWAWRCATYGSLHPLRRR